GDRAVTDTGSRIAGPVLITGTDTGVGKTIVTAAIAAAATAAGVLVAVIKPAQTGVPDAYPLDTPGDEPDVVTVAPPGRPAAGRPLAHSPPPPPAVATAGGEM